MERIFLGKIHSVVAGINPRNRQESLGYTVGTQVDSTHPNIKVSSISMDDSAYQENGDKVCRIWVIDTKKKDREFVYKTLINLPLTLSVDLDS